MILASCRAFSERNLRNLRSSCWTTCCYPDEDRRTSTCRPHLRPLVQPRSPQLVDGHGRERDFLEVGSGSRLGGRVSSLAAAERRPTEPLQLGGQTIIKAGDLAAGERT